MAETPLSRTIDAFDDARGIAMDGVWAHSVSWALLMRDVEADLVREGLEEALDVVRQSQEAPEELFGAPRAHAGELYDRWVTEGRLRLDKLGAIAWRDVPSTGLAWGAALCLAFAVVFALEGDSPRTWTLGMVVLPLGLGLGTTAAAAAWDWFLRHNGTASAIASAAATGIICAMAAASVNEWSKAHPLGNHSVWWYVPIAVSCVLLATGWRRWVDTWTPLAPPAAADADEWSRQLAGHLRERYSLSDSRVRTILFDAHSHAAESGSTLEEEFGRPEDYAARFVPDLARRSRLTVAFYLFVSALNLVGTVVIDSSWRGLLIAAGFGWLAWREHLRHRTLRDDSD